MSGSPGPVRESFPPLVPREVVAERLALSMRLLRRYESRGLVRAQRRGDLEGFAPDEVRRLWTVQTLHRDLGVNLAGIEAILKLRQHVQELHSRLAVLADELREALEEPFDDAPGDP